MKSILFNEITTVYFLFLLLTHFLIRKGRHDFATTQKMRYLLPAVVSAALTFFTLTSYGFSKNWWMMIGLFNLSILLVIVTDVLLEGLARLFMQTGGLRRV